MAEYKPHITIAKNVKKLPKWDSKFNIDIKFDKHSVRVNKKEIWSLKDNRKIIKEEELIGGLADNKSLDDISKKHKVPLEEIKRQFQMGLKVEKEHTHDIEVAKEIVLDHLVENPRYYDRLLAAKL